MSRTESGQIVEGEFASVVEPAKAQLEAAGGGALCVYWRGRSVLDVWDGYKDPATRRPWESDTMAMSWSTTKGVASTALHMLVDRGELAYDDLIAEYWPEFAVSGKQHTTIRQLLSMEAGLFDIRHLIDNPRLMLDHDAMASALAAATPRHAPGDKNGYHAMTYGWLVAEILQRITGHSLGAFVRTEISEPLGLDGCHIGTPEEELGRVAAFPDLAPENNGVRLIAKTLNPVTSLFGVSLERIASAFVPNDANDVIASDEFLQAEVPSVNGTFTARSLARLYAALGSDDGVDGVQVWTPPTRDAARQQQNRRRDRVVPIRVGWQLGFHQPFPHKKTAPNSFGFYGAYGSGGFADPERQLAVGLVCQQAKGLPMTKLVEPILSAADRAGPDSAPRVSGSEA